MEQLRPFDILSRAKGKEVEISLKNNIIYKGKLKAFDIHLNVVLFETEEIKDKNSVLIGDLIIRGDMIITIKNI